MGIKFIHTADLHLDSKLESNLTPEMATKRRGELIDAFERMVGYARREKVRAILIAGDMFDRTHIRKLAKNRVLDIMRENGKIDFLYLKGNHDKTDFPGELSRGEFPRNLKLFDDESWTSYSYGSDRRIVISGRELTPDNAKTLATNLILDVAKLNIVMLHGQESEYQGRDKTPVINLPALKGKYIDYLALGHIHSYKCEKLDDRGEYCYSGCLEGRGFDECGPKGFVLLEADEEARTISHRFIPFAERTMHSIEVSVEPRMGMGDIIKKIRSDCEAIRKEDLVKVVLTGDRELDFEIDRERLVALFSKEFFFFKVYDETKGKIDYDSFLNDRSLKGEFVRLMMRQDMDKEERDRIIDLGMSAILGSEEL